MRPSRLRNQKYMRRNSRRANDWDWLANEMVLTTYSYWNSHFRKSKPTEKWSISLTNGRLHVDTTRPLSCSVRRNTSNSCDNCAHELCGSPSWQLLDGITKAFNSQNNRRVNPTNVQFAHTRTSSHRYLRIFVEILRFPHERESECAIQ